MGCMTDPAFDVLHPRAGAGAANPGEFAEKSQSAPDLLLGWTPNEPRMTVDQNTVGRNILPVPYPSDIPAGGVVSIDTDDSSNDTFAMMTLPDGRYFATGTDAYGDTWTNESDYEDEEDADGEDEERERIYEYLRLVRDQASYATTELRDAALKSSTQTILDRINGVAPDSSDEGARARRLDAGLQLTLMFADDTEDEETAAADAIADILTYLNDKGYDAEEILGRARDYADSDS